MNTRSPLFIVGAIIVVLIILFAGWQLMQGNQAVAPTPSPVSVSPTPTPEASEITVNLSEQSDSGQSGTAVLMEENGMVKVTINATALSGSQPAHIHMGACPKPGEVKWPLSNVEDGKSETVLNTTMAEIKANLPLAINLHKSEAEVSVYTSCGDLPNQ